ncbi:MAG: hypothetical protein CL561_04935 [Alphaproteobacteria bacterium]|nr:hypothetical protein [Alphaproteobacteria bacterium]|tara:strand:+ start:463 stop:1098 length:636 start_codon:yes stop_codon:yes gene_type:complete
MTYTLTADQLIDILLQAEERVTAGALDKRSMFQKLSDSVFSYKRKEMVDYGPNSLQSLKRSLMIEFDEAAKVVTEHPKSLKKAILELKTLGYSNKQIHDITSDVKRFALSYLYDNNPVKTAVKKDYPNYYFTWNDESFLGTALQELPGEFDEPRYHLSLNEVDNATTHNTAFTSSNQALAESYFRDYYKATIARHPEYLTPEKPKGLALTL